MNAVVVQGDAVGTTLYYGKGAGSEPTASAVVADLVDITRLHTADPDHRVPHLAFRPDALAQHADPADGAKSSPPTTCGCAWPTRPACCRASPPSWPSTTSRSTLCCSANPPRARRQTDLIILTHDTREGCMNQAMATMQALPTRAGADRAHSQRRTQLRYVSTRGDATPRAFCDILLEGLAPDGGLYLPARYPKVDAATLARWRALPYADLAFEILSLYIDDIPAADLRALCRKTYDRSVFGSDAITPLRALEPGLWIQGLSNGPTLAFKDMAMQLLGALFEYELGARAANASTSWAPPRATPAVRPSTRCAASAACKSSCCRRRDA